MFVLILNYVLRVNFRNYITKLKNIYTFHTYCQVALLKDCTKLLPHEKKQESSLPHTFSTIGIMIIFK